MTTICGIDCNECPMKGTCGGCIATEGRPFGGDCMLANCCKNKHNELCAKCPTCELKNRFIAEFNALGIKDMPTITELYALKGEYINLEYDLPGGKVKFWQDDKIYLGAQVDKGNGRCYGLTADENYLLVCEYGENGIDPEVVLFKKR